MWMNWRKVRENRKDGKRKGRDSSLEVVDRDEEGKHRSSDRLGTSKTT